MKTYYIWIATFEENDFEQYWDNEPYENELKLFKEGLGAKPDISLKCGFCRETGLEELDEKDFWFCFRASLCNVRELAKDYISDLDEFEKLCNAKGILEGNVIWGVAVKDFPDLDSEGCSSMKYVGILKV